MNVWNATRAALSFRNNDEEVVRVETLPEWVSGFQEVRIFTTQLIFTNTYGSKMIKESFQLYSHGEGEICCPSSFMREHTHTSQSQSPNIHKYPIIMINSKIKGSFQKSSGSRLCPETTSLFILDISEYSS